MSQKWSVRRREDAWNESCDDVNYNVVKTSHEDFMTFSRCPCALVCSAAVNFKLGQRNGACCLLNFELSKISQLLFDTNLDKFLKQNIFLRFLRCFLISFFTLFWVCLSNRLILFYGDNQNEHVFKEDKLFHWKKYYKLNRSKQIIFTQ